VLEHGAGGDLGENGAAQLEPVDQRVERGGQHVPVGGLRVGTVASCERNPDAAEHGDAADARVHLDSSSVA
jgi:hypothetical protein